LVKILNFFDADPGSRMEKIRIRDEKRWIRDPDPKSESGSGIRIRDKHPGSATLPTNLECKVKKTKNTYQIPHVSPFSANFM
jgi:hypothetical protein